MIATNKELLLKLCDAVMKSQGESQNVQAGAEMLLIAFIYNFVELDLMKSCHEFAVKAGYDFSGGAN